MSKLSSSNLSAQCSPCILTFWLPSSMPHLPEISPFNKMSMFCHCNLLIQGIRYNEMWQVHWDTSGKCFMFWAKPVYENQNFQEWRGQVCQRTFLLSTWEGQCILLLKVYSTICITCDVFIATFPSVSLLLLHKHTTHTLETVEPPKNTCQGTLKIRECHYYLFFHLDWNILGIFIHVGHGATILLLVQQ